MFLLLKSALFLLTIQSILFGSILDSANSAYSQGKLRQSIVLYKKALTAGDNPALCYFNMGNAWFKLDSLPQAAVSYNACSWYAPDFARGHLNRAVVYYQLDEMGECIAAATRALQLDTANSKTMLLLSSAYRRSGALALAATTLEQLLETNPDHTEALWILGSLYYDWADYVTAMRWLTMIDETTTYGAPAAQRLAECAIRMQDTTRALFYLQQSLERDPARRSTLYQIALLLHAIKNDALAIEYINNGLSRFADYADLAMLGGTISLTQKNLGTALHFFAKARALGSAAAIAPLREVEERLRGETLKNSH